MIVFLILANLMALSAAWLLYLPVLSYPIARGEKWRIAAYLLLAVWVFPLALYSLVTFL